MLKEHMDEYRTLVPIAIKMKMHGLRISKVVYEKHRAELDATAENLRTEFATLLKEASLSAENYALGENGANDALKDLFFEALGCPVVSYSEETGGPALNSAALGTYLKEGTDLQKRFSRCTLAYRKVTKLRGGPNSRKGFYAYPKWMYEQPDGDLRCHPNTNPLGTQGSRSTMNSPNAQQLTKGTYIAGKRITPNIRECIVADPGYVLMEADHSQQELRLIAYVMDVDKLIEWFRQGKDVHKMHAASLLNKPESTITKKERDFGKKVFGFNYNLSDDVTTVYESMKADFPDTTMGFVKGVRAAYMALHPNIPKGQNALIAEAKQTHRIVCRISGRFRQFYAGRVDPNQTLNFCMQTGGGAIMNRAMLMLDPHINWDDGEAILLNIHDALLVQVRLERVPEMSKLLCAAMGVSVDIGKHKGISIPVDWSFGTSWGNQRHFRGVHIELPELLAAGFAVR